MVKLELRDRIEDGLLDLSMSELEEVPLKEMVPIKHKVKKLDLSNNLLTSLQPTFASQMVLLIELDLSKNSITEIPENFGLLVNLVHLDLYSNKIERLPLSFKELIKLRWLDLKDNPLTPQLAKIAGPCVDQSDCQKCAREVVLVMQEISRSIEEKKQQKAEDRQHGAPKEKKKKKKSKGTSVSSDTTSRSQLNGANQISLSTHVEEKSMHDNDVTKKSGSNKSKSSMSCCASLYDDSIRVENVFDIDILGLKCVPHEFSTTKDFSPALRLCCTFTRALVWSLILLSFFIATLFILNLPACRPYTDKAVEHYKEVQLKVLDVAGDLPDKMNLAYDWLRDTSSKGAIWTQEFITKALPIYLENTKVFMIDVWNKVVNQITLWINDKKD